MIYRFKFYSTVKQLNDSTFPTYNLQPTTYNLNFQPTTYNLQPTTYNLKLTTYNLQLTQLPQLTTYNLQLSQLPQPTTFLFPTASPRQSHYSTNKVFILLTDTTTLLWQS
jgi:hypothetical protein